MRMPRAAATAASDWPRPVVSLPSQMSTSRFWVPSGNSADASRSAPPTSVAERTGTDASRSTVVQLRGQPLDQRIRPERDDGRLVAGRAAAPAPSGGT